jgi:hypothetical protein
MAIAVHFYNLLNFKKQICRMKKLLLALSFISLTVCSAETYQKGRLVKSEQVIEYGLTKTVAGYAKGARRSDEGYSNDRLNNYDKHGNLTESYLLEPDAKPRLISKYSYNSSHKITKAEEYNEKGLLSVTEYIYDSKDRLISEEYKIKENAAGLKSALEKYNYYAGAYAYTVTEHEFDGVAKEYVLSNTQYIMTDKTGNVTERLYKAAGAATYYRKEYKKYNDKNLLVEAAVDDKREKSRTRQQPG